jgi:EAL domain-containing protein (putative c-di-GMP-specific phosphodiesterase class I)
MTLKQAPQHDRVLATGDCETHSGRDIEWPRTELQHGIDESQFTLHYQPLICLATGEMEGVEALLRWRHPEHGMLAADSFIDALSRQRLLTPLLPRLIEDACQTVVALDDATDTEPYVALNVDPQQFAQDPVVDLIETTLTATGAQPQSLLVEMTERTDALDDSATLAAAHHLSALGVQLAIDDFGTGHSTLTRLRALPAAKLKIDRTFVRDVVTSEEDRAIVASVITLAHGLGVGCVAEGVECLEQVEVLEELGCPTAQGFFLGKPVSSAEMTNRLRAAVA